MLPFMFVRKSLPFDLLCQDPIFAQTGNHIQEIFAVAQKIIELKKEYSVKVC